MEENQDVESQGWIKIDEKTWKLKVKNGFVYKDIIGDPNGKEPFSAKYFFMPEVPGIYPSIL